MSKHVLCCVSSTSFSESFLNDLHSFLKTSGAQILSEEPLSEKVIFARDFILDFPHDEKKIKTELLKLSERHQTDLALMDFSGRDQRRLVIFDMDSTLIQHEVIDEMAVVHGIGDEVKKITERAMNGELNFDQSLTERVALLKGLKKEALDEIRSRLKLTPGVETFIREVKKKGYKTAIVSGGFQYFADHFKQKLGMDYAFANDLEWEGETLTGKVQGSIVNAERKAQILKELTRKENLDPSQVVAVGDGANDIPMLAAAGFGIAFHAKEKVRQSARHHLSFGPMTTLLYFLGIPGNHLHETL